MQLPTYAELRRLVEVEGWQDKDHASRRKKGDHHRYILALETGKVLYSRLSHGSGQIHNRDLWSHILRDQLMVSETEFWRCVDDGVVPPRPEAKRVLAIRPALDAKFVRNLIRKAGMSPEQVAKLSKDEAVAAWHDYLARGGSYHLATVQH